ncbi:helix-turn-helix domain-containing protein [Pseudonocardia sp. TRM90224]|uniref:helix-turn-helix domain-containing protein n=1 Tax=Pseudonocardia sp. TRM90224 TaxID=2812678 RepID=UPI001E5C1FF3|nr:helix-turn-helix domain-containing protein [Pseudonocardia sp. TRM90224]
MADAADFTANRERQRELYGAPLGERVRRITTGLGISQARLARAIGLSPAMLSQLVSARRVKIGDPAVLARLHALDRRTADIRIPPEPKVVEKMLADVSGARWNWSGAHVSAQRRVQAVAADAMRGVAEPARLAAAAAMLGPGFPELAAVLRQAAHGRR